MMNNLPSKLPPPTPKPQPESNLVALVPKAIDIIPENVQDKIVPFEPNWGDEPDFDLMAIVAELEHEAQNNPTTSNTIQNLELIQQHNLSMFAGFRIENKTMNINKK